MQYNVTTCNNKTTYGVRQMYAGSYAKDSGKPCAMNAIQEKESPTFMGEPVLKTIDGGLK